MTHNNPAGVEWSQGPDFENGLTLESDRRTEEDRRAKRDNAGKLRFSLIPALATEEVARVFTEGADRYGDENWRKPGFTYKSVADSMLRHINAFLRGEDRDPQTGFLHTAHIVANAMFLTEMGLTGSNGNPEVDDRIKHIEGNGTNGDDKSKKEDH